MTKILTQHFVLAVPDLARSVAFYQDVLGFRQDFQVDGWRFLSRDGARIMLGECPDAIPARDLGDHSYFAYFEVEEIDELHSHVARSDTEILSPLSDKEWGMREFGIRTVDGHRILFGQNL